VGTEIHLEIGGVTLAWSKNSRGMDHGALFQELDNKPHFDSSHYESDDDEQESILPHMAFVRPLKDMRARLELLGFTHKTIEVEYNGVRKECLETNQYLNDEGLDACLDLQSFSEFQEFIQKHPINELDDTFIAGVSDKDDIKAMGRFHRDQDAKRVPLGIDGERGGYSERNTFANLIGILHPYSILRLLSDVPENLEENVIWKYGPLVNAGWADVSEFSAGARRTDTFLIATEGTSDIHILKHAISILRPEISDFFKFIDISESHPFSGAGNLARFAEGLAKIDVHNQVVFLLDNDAEGVSIHKRIEELSLPDNMSAITLPNIEAFKEFQTRGPTGDHVADINGTAAAIECYLDLEYERLPNPVVMWTSFRKDVGSYQGELLNKGKYAKAFYKRSRDDLENGSYDFGRIARLLHSIYLECCSLKVS